MSEAHIQLVRRWFDEVWNQRRTETIDELLGEDSVCHGDGVDLRGPEQFRREQYEPLVNAFPDVDCRIESIVCQGDEVVVRWSGRGHHTGDGLGIPPTGEEVHLRGMTWITVRGGKLLEGYQRSNIRDVLADLARRGSQDPGPPPAAAAPF